MKNNTQLEAWYQKYKNNLNHWLPEGITQVDLELLHRLDLLHFHTGHSEDNPLTRYFHVIETEEKLTLANDDFIVWIVPDKEDEVPLTCTLIALNKEDNLHLELAFITKGIYNNSYLVLRLLERYLIEIQTTEDLINRLEKSG